MVSSIIGYVLLPTLGELHGAKEQERLREFLVTLNRVIGFVAPFLAAIGAALTPLVVLVFFPSYHQATETAQVLIAGATFSVIASTAGQFLIVSGRYRRYATVQVVSIFMKTAICLIAVYMGYGTLGIAMGSTIGFAFFGFFMLLSSLRDCQVAGSELVVQMGGYFAPWLLNFGIVGFAHVFVPVVDRASGISIVGLTAVLGGLIVVNIPSLMYLDRQFTLRARLRESIAARRAGRMPGGGRS